MRRSDRLTVVCLVAGLYHMSLLGRLGQRLVPKARPAGASARRMGTKGGPGSEEFLFGEAVSPGHSARRTEMRVVMWGGENSELPAEQCFCRLLFRPWRDRPSLVAAWT